MSTSTDVNAHVLFLKYLEKGRLQDKRFIQSLKLLLEAIRRGHYQMYG